MHHLNEAGILYVDVCIPNLMVNAQDHSEGVLIDLDDCIRATHPEDAQGYSNQGLRCLAIDLLRDPPPPRRYVHSLQSFFWCLWFILLNYRNGVHVLSPDTAPWHRGTLKAMSDAKVSFVRLGDEYEDRIIAFCESLGCEADALFFLMKTWTKAEHAAVQGFGARWDYSQVCAALQETIEAV